MNEKCIFLEKYQDTNLFLQYLPYCDKLDAEADEWLKEIKENLGRAIMIRFSSSVFVACNINFVALN